jgi:predicted HAD superfamily Cof-like phosphohydrolase
MSINDAYYKVRDFHIAFNHPYSDVPKVLDMELAQKRANWIKEEVEEMLEATVLQDIYEQADAFIDIIYFALGGLVNIGVPPDKIFDIVQNANMSKLWEDGKPRFREGDGKIIKPPHWEDPHDKIVKAINNMMN